MGWVKGQSGNPAGRKRGLKNKRARELEAEARARGMTPLQVMQSTVEHLMRRAARAQEPEKSALRIQASDIASRIAPYIHPRLQAVAVVPADEMRDDINAARVAIKQVGLDVSRLSDEQLRAIEEFATVIDARPTGVPGHFAPDRHGGVEPSGEG